MQSPPLEQPDNGQVISPGSFSRTLFLRLYLVIRASTSITLLGTTTRAPAGAEWATRRPDVIERSGAPSSPAMIAVRCHGIWRRVLEESVCGPDGIAHRSGALSGRATDS